MRFRSELKKIVDDSINCPWKVISFSKHFIEFDYLGNIHYRIFQD